MRSDGQGIDPDFETTVAEVASGLGNGSIQVIDVREQDEWAEGRIAGSVLMPMSEFGNHVHSIDPATPIVTVCLSGVRSLYIAQTLANAGFPNVKSMAGGMNAWLAAGQPVDV